MSASKSWRDAAKGKKKEPARGRPGRSEVFRTDTQISGSAPGGGEGEGGSDRFRQLQKWEPDADVPEDETLGAMDGSAKGWDQFAANKRFGYKSTWDDSMSEYTTPLPNDPKFYEAHLQHAAAVERMIVSKVAHNTHMAEERGQKPLQDYEDEEDRYGSVVRDAPDASATKRYVPPSRRGEAPSNGKTAWKKAPTPASAVPAKKSVSVPAATDAAAVATPPASAAAAAAAKPTKTPLSLGKPTGARKALRLNPSVKPFLPKSAVKAKPFVPAAKKGKEAAAPVAAAASFRDARVEKGAAHTDDVMHLYADRLSPALTGEAQSVYPLWKDVVSPNARPYSSPSQIDDEASAMMVSPPMGAYTMGGRGAPVVAMGTVSPGFGYAQAAVMPMYARPPMMGGGAPVGGVSSFGPMGAPIGPLGPPGVPYPGSGGSGGGGGGGSGGSGGGGGGVGRGVGGFPGFPPGAAVAAGSPYGTGFGPVSYPPVGSGDGSH